MENNKTHDDQHGDEALSLFGEGAGLGDHKAVEDKLAAQSSTELESSWTVFDSIREAPLKIERQRGQKLDFSQ